ncbi:MAG: DNA translocase FtsK [Elusimicrobia bacterium]|nr:DNA translocase FtsK [Elusimicrobiota bacterium]
MRKKLHSRNSRQKNNNDFAALILLGAAFLCAYVLAAPYNSGIFGQAASNILTLLFGKAAWLLPLILVWFFILILKRSLVLREKLDIVLAFAVIVLGSTVSSLAAINFNPALMYAGGFTGERLSPFFLELLGAQLALVFVSLLFIVTSSIFFRISLIRIALNFYRRLKTDINESLTKKPDASSATQTFERAQKKQDFTYPETEPNIIKHELIKASPAAKEQPLKNNSARADSAVHSDNAQEQTPHPKDFPYILPSAGLLADDEKAFSVSEAELKARAELLSKTLGDFQIEARVQDIISGPVVTRYDLVLAPGTKIQSVIALTDNLSLALKSASIRIVPIPEKSAVGVEVPNIKMALVGLKGILESINFTGVNSLLSLALGKTTNGQGYVADLAKMPHLLIAGSTGSGKSVGIHTILLSMLFKARPDEVKFMLIDPKRVEMPIYKDLPHIYNPCTTASNADIITNPREATAALKKLVTVMESRYEKFAKEMVRNIEGYNQKMAETGGDKEFYIVVVIDELADLMLVAAKEIEDSIQRLAQMARAVGIHLILATQRPSVNVITGVIKANFPARMSFQTTSKIDSRVILDALGAENLIGKGDMLFLPPAESRPIRLQGAYVSASEAERVIEFINAQNFPRFYEPLTVEVAAPEGQNFEDKALKDLIPALMLIKERRAISQDLLKANFGSSARATNILSMLAVKGFIFKPEGTNKWNINYDKIEGHLNENT